MTAALPPDENDQEVLALCLPTEQQLLVLVKPSFASGAFGCCSVWRGANDNKLYVRKLMTTKKGEPKPPKDISYHRNLPIVPKLVTSIKHDPVPVRNGRVEGFDVTCEAGQKNFWSAIYEYVPSPTLQKYLETASFKKQQIPEAVIWEYGNTTLEFIQQLLYPDDILSPKYQRQWNHNNLWAGNILISNDQTKDRACNFHVIDYGSATSDIYQRPSIVDIRFVGKTLNLMIKAHTGQAGTSSRAIAYDLARQYGQAWPYSDELNSAIDDLWWMMRSFEVISDRKVLARHVQKFQDGSERAFESCQYEDLSYNHSVEDPLTDQQAVSWPKHPQVLHDLQSWMTDKAGVFPCQKMIANNALSPNPKIYQGRQFAIIRYQLLLLSNLRCQNPLNDQQ